MSEIDPQLLKHKYLYVPYLERADTLPVGKALALFLAQQNHGHLTVLATQTSNVAADPALKNFPTVTERSGSVHDGGVVLAWCPTHKAMDKISHLAESVVVAVEWPTTRLEGWAKLVGAYNVITNQVMESGISALGMEALDDIISEEYNDWHNAVARTLTLDLLQELADTDGYDRELVLAFARRAKGDYSIDNLTKILNIFESTASSSKR